MVRGVRRFVGLSFRIGVVWLCALLRMFRGSEEFIVLEKDWDFVLEG